MKVIYVAGPFRGPNAWVIEENIRRAERLALEVWRLGAACICPHSNTRFFQGAAEDAVWMAGDLEFIRRSDALLMTPDLQQSSGARAEEALARELGIPVFYALEEVARWLTASSNISVAVSKNF